MKPQNRVLEKSVPFEGRASEKAIASLLAADLYVLAFLIPLKFGVPNLDVASPLLPTDLAGITQYAADFFRALITLKPRLALKIVSDVLSSPWPEEMAQILIILAFFLWGMKSFSRRTFALQVTRIDAAMWLFVLAGLAATLFSPARHSSVVILKQFFSYALLYFVVRHALDAHHQQRRLIKCFLVSTSLVALLGLYQFIFGFEETAQAVRQQIAPELQPDYLARLSRRRVFSVFIYPNSLAGFLLAAFPLAAMHLTLHREWFHRKSLHKLIAYVLLLPVVSLATFLLTQSKASLLAFLIVAVASVVAARKKVGLKRRFVLLGLLLALVLFSVFLLSPVGRNLIIEKGLYTFSERVGYWKAGFAMFLRSPIIGSGFNSFGLLYPQYRLVGAGETRSAHNNYLQLLVETGIVGLVFFAGIWIFALAAAAPFVGRYLRGELAETDPFRQTVVLSAFTGILCFLLHSLADFDLYVPGIAMTVWLFLALMVKNARPAEARQIQLTRHLSAASTVALVAFCGLALFFASKTLNSGSHLDMAQSLLKETDGQHPPDYQSAILEMKKAINWDGTNHNLHLYLAGIYLKLGWYDEALSEYAIADGLRRFSPAIAHATARAKLEKMKAEGGTNWDEVLASFRKAVRLSPTSPFHRLVYAYYLDRSGRRQEGQDELREAKRLDSTAKEAIKTARIIYRNDPVVEELQRFFGETDPTSQSEPAPPPA